ncbi:hypothetical protein GW17_00023024 [Ensete ventricosum]|nr:hypothetical protein GW17_00023024 [Ensete ventricosum]
MLRYSRCRGRDPSMPNVLEVRKSGIAPPLLLKMQRLGIDPPLPPSHLSLPKVRRSGANAPHHLSATSDLTSTQDARYAHDTLRRLTGPVGGPRTVAHFTSWRGNLGASLKPRVDKDPLRRLFGVGSHPPPTSLLSR